MKLWGVLQAGQVNQVACRHTFEDMGVCTLFRVFISVIECDWYLLPMVSLLIADILMVTGFGNMVTNIGVLPVLPICY